MDILKQYITVEETTETLFSIIIYDKKISEIIKFFEDQLEKAKKITNPVKKTKINNRLFNFLQYINDIYGNDLEGILNSIFLINNNIIEYKLNNDEIKVAKEYNFTKVFIKSDTKFCIEYIIDLFYNNIFIYTIKINKNDVNINKINKNKEKELDKLKNINEQKINEELERIRKLYNYKDLIIIYGISSLFGKINILDKNIIIQTDFLNRDELCNLYENELMKKNHILLNKKLEDIKNEKTNIDLYIFGKLKFEIKDAIESYTIKELYIEDIKLEKLKSFIDTTFLNFKIIPIKSLEMGDIADTFIKDYNGIMGIKYY